MDETGDILKTISEPTRYRIVRLLLKRHHCARSLSKELGISEAAVSQHMSVLRKHGIVTSFRHGYHLHYVLDRGVVERVARELTSWLDDLDAIEDCHTLNPCRFVLDDGSNGCLYRSAEGGKGKDGNIDEEKETRQ